jgi:hypothetical protein
MRIAIGLQSLPNRLHRASFRIYLHPAKAIEAGIRRAGLERHATHTTLTWDIRIYAAAAG